jgi:hypothetical protein
MSICDENRIHIVVTVDSEPYQGIRSILFKKGISFQDFVNCIAVLIFQGDETILELIERAKNKRIVNLKDPGKTRNKFELFDALEQASPLKGKEI